MKKKILIIILLILIVVFFIVLGVKLFKKSPSTKQNETTRDFILDEEQSTSKVNTHGENAGIYVGVNELGKENFLFISIKIDKSASKEEQIRSLISSISSTIGYQIELNSVKVEDNKIKIDFSKDYAPFEVIESYNQSNSQLYYISSDNVVAKTIFDSINKTLKSYFGENTETYFSGNSENINIENDFLTITIDSSKPYDKQ